VVETVCYLRFAAPSSLLESRRPTDLYVCDIDGTLLGPDARLSEFARDGLNELLAAGVQLTLASSRRTISMRSLFAGGDLSLPVIEVNGAFVSELHSGRHLAA
jgi:5-amino-6-(5-phospho-D-ribitylamino)uracil phosphatase